MKTQNGFTLMQNNSDIIQFLKSQRVHRTISRIQIHHMALPDYNTWKNTDCRKFKEPHFGRTESLDSYGKSTWGSRSANGKYIAQHFNIFPDGQITSGRSLNSNPIGIRGWNTNAICIEIYGNFDKGKDKMNSDQRKAVIALVGELCKRFDISPSENTIRYHGWFTSGGSYLGDYNPSRSRKSCPGTNFFGGNTMAAYKKYFLPEVKNYINGKLSSNNTNSNNVIQAVNKTVKIAVNELNVRSESNNNSNIICSVKKDDVYTIVAQQGNWGKLKSGVGWINLSYVTDITKYEDFRVRVTANSLNIRKQPNANSEKTGNISKGGVYTIVEVKNNWGKLKSGAGWICLTYTEKL